MPFILHIETATIVCSVALSHDENLISRKESSEKNSHSASLTLFIEEVMQAAGIALSQLNAIAVSEGPGSYTGLRIGVATAKGLCYSLDKPLIGVPTLQSMAKGMADLFTQPPSGLPFLFCPMIDARRMEVFSAVFTRDNELFREVKAEIIDENSFSEYLASYHLIFAGDGAEKCKPILEKHPNVSFLNHYEFSAASMIPIATAKFRNSQFEDVAYFEPAYLKDFIAGKPRVKGLR